MRLELLRGHPEEPFVDQCFKRCVLFAAANDSEDVTWTPLSHVRIARDCSPALGRPSDVSVLALSLRCG